MNRDCNTDRKPIQRRGLPRQSDSRQVPLTGHAMALTR
jgi:hypothetical protein